MFSLIRHIKPSSPLVLNTLLTHRHYTTSESQHYYKQLIQGSEAPFITGYNLLRSGFKTYDQYRSKYHMLFSAIHQAKMTFKKEGNMSKANEMDRKMLDFIDQMRGVGISKYHVQEYYQYLME